MTDKGAGDHIEDINHPSKFNDPIVNARVKVEYPIEEMGKKKVFKYMYTLLSNYYIII